MVTTNEKFKPHLLVPKQIDPSLHTYITNWTDIQDIAVELIEHPNKITAKLDSKVLKPSQTQGSYSGQLTKLQSLTHLLQSH